MVPSVEKKRFEISIFFVLVRANRASEQAYKLNYAYIKTFKFNFKQVKLVFGAFSFVSFKFLKNFLVIYLQKLLSNLPISL